MTPENEVPKEEECTAKIEAGCLLVKLPESPKAYAVIMPQDKMAVLLNYAAVLCDGPMQLAPFESVEFKPRPDAVLKEDATLIYHPSYRSAKLYAMEKGIQNWNYISKLHEIKGLQRRKLIVLLGRIKDMDPIDTEAEALIMEAKLREFEVVIEREW